MASQNSTTPTQLSFALPGEQIDLALVYPAPEQWRPVLGWEGIYEVSDYGRVRSLPRVIPHPTWGRQRLRGVIIQGQRNQRYHRVHLRAAGRFRNASVHELVLEAFVGPRPKGYQCNHKDRKRFNNRLDNLEWVTQQENSNHKYATGKLNLRKGEDHPRAKLTDEQVYKIRRLAAQGSTYVEISRLFAVDETMISFIVRRKNWKHLPEED
jgi:hypothetical protein